MSLKPKLAWLVAVVALLVTASPVAAEEEGTDPLLTAETTTTVTVVPSLVLPDLMVVIQADSNGNLVSVELHSTTLGEGSAPESYEATKVDNRRVRFETSEGITRVEVKARHNKLETKFRAGSLDDLLGTHTWTGEVLGEEVTVTFTIGGDDVGGPTLDVESVVLVTDSTLSHTISGPSTKSELDEIEVEAKLKFENDLGQRAELKIEVEVHTAAADHDPGRASLKLKLKTRDERTRVQLPDPGADPVAHGWTGTLCDGEAVSVSWTIDNAGAISPPVVVADTAEVEINNDGFKIRFGDGSKLEVKVKVKDDGVAEVRVEPKIKCHDAADPFVNTDIGDDDHSGRDGHDDRDRSDDDHSGRGGGSDDD